MADERCKNCKSGDRVSGLGMVMCENKTFKNPNDHCDKWKLKPVDEGTLRKLEKGAQPVKDKPIPEEKPEGGDNMAESFNEVRGETVDAKELDLGCFKGKRPFAKLETDGTLQITCIYDPDGIKADNYKDSVALGIRLDKESAIKLRNWLMKELRG